MQVIRYFILVYLKNKQLNDHLPAFIFFIIKIRIPMIIIIAFKPNLFFGFVFLIG
jgi:hypothetical protein